MLSQCKYCQKEFRPVRKGNVHCSKKCNTLSWRSENADQVAEYNKQYKTKHKSKCKQHNKEWKQKNPAKNSYTQSKRRAAKLQATPSWADQNIIKDFYLEAEYHQMQVDHIIPLQSEIVCGLHCEDNMQLLSSKDNSSKGNSFHV